MHVDSSEQEGSRKTIQSIHHLLDDSRLRFFTTLRCDVPSERNKWSLLEPFHVQLSATLCCIWNWSKCLAELHCRTPATFDSATFKCSKALQYANKETSYNSFPISIRMVSIPRKFGIQRGRKIPLSFGAGIWIGMFASGRKRSAFCDIFLGVFFPTLCWHTDYLCGLDMLGYLL